MTDAVLDQAMLAALERNEGQSELVDGEVVPVSPAGFAHARTVMQIGRLLADFAERTDCGVVIAGDPGFIWDERNVRAPDLAVVSKVDAKKAPQKGFMPFAPLLAVEVVSPTDSWRSIHMKAQGWLIHGAKSVWVVDPIDKLVVIHNPDQSLRELRMNDSLENDLALPGFSCQVDHFFK